MGRLTFGEAEIIRQRIKQHKTKEFRVSAITFVCGSRRNSRRLCKRNAGVEGKRRARVHGLQRGRPDYLEPAR